MNRHSNIWQSARLLLLCPPITLLSMGCLERKETIKVHPDGAVAIGLEFKGDKGELDGPFALPTARQGWRVKRDQVPKHVLSLEIADKKGNEKDTEDVLEATAKFDAGKTLPSTFGDGSDVYLRFPTTVRREEKEDGVYYHFARTYVPRSFTHIQLFKKIFIEDKLEELEEEKNFDDLTRSERGELLSAFAKFEMFKQLELLQCAADRIERKPSQLSWLKSCKALQAVFEKFTRSHIDKLLDDLDREAGEA